MFFPLQERKDSSNTQNQLHRQKTSSNHLQTLKDAILQQYRTDNQIQFIRKKFLNKNINEISLNETIKSKEGINRQDLTLKLNRLQKNLMQKKQCQTRPGQALITYYKGQKHESERNINMIHQKIIKLFIQLDQKQENQNNIKLQQIKNKLNVFYESNIQLYHKKVRKIDKLTTITQCLNTRQKQIKNNQQQINIANGQLKKLIASRVQKMKQMKLIETKFIKLL